jgi:hypothetical protein
MSMAVIKLYLGVKEIFSEDQLFFVKLMIGIIFKTSISFYDYKYIRCSL